MCAVMGRNSGSGPAGVSVRLLEERAKRLGRGGEWGALALGVNSRILEIDPGNVGALTRRARCNVALDDYPAAKADFERALELGPASGAHKEQLVRGLEEIHKGWEQAAGRFEKREEEARRRDKEADRARARVRRRAEKRARLLAEIGEIAGVEEARAPGVLYAGGYRGSARGGGEGASLGRPPAVGVDLELAEAALRRAWEVDPRRSGPGNPSAGARDPGFAQGLAPLYEVPTRLAGVFRARGELTRAAAAYERVMEREESAYARVGLAAVRQDQGRPGEALALYEGVLEDNPCDVYAWRGIARTLANLGRVEEAVAAYERAAGLFSDEARRSRSGLRRLLAELGRAGRTEEAEAVERALGRLDG